MTAPAAPPAINTGSFRGQILSPPAVQAIITAVVGGSPFLDSLTLIRSNSGTVVWPSVAFDDPKWIAEMGLIPLLDSNTDAYVVGAAKLAGIVLVSNEMIGDSAIPVTRQLETALRDTFSATAERDLIAGTADGPAGILANAPVTAGEDLWAAAIRAKAEIAANGGVATHIAVNAADAGAEEGRRNNVGDPLYPQGLGQLAGLAVVAARSASRPIVYDASRCFTVVRQDWQVLSSSDYSPAFERDAIALRIVGRLNVAVPTPDRSIRALDIPGPTGTLTVAAHGKKS